MPARAKKFGSCGVRLDIQSYSTIGLRLLMRSRNPFVKLSPNTKHRNLAIGRHSLQARISKDL